MLARAVEAYRKIRNTLRYLIANLYDFDPAVDSVAREQMEEVDRYILARYGDLATASPSAYDDVRLRHDLPGGECVRDRRPQRVLRRCFQGSPVHLRGAVARAAFGADRDVSDGRRPDAAARADSVLHRRRALATPAGTARGFGSHGGVSQSPRSWRAGRTPISLRDLGHASSRCASACWPKSSRSGRSKQIGSSLQAKVILTAHQGGAGSASSSTPRDLPMLFIVSEVELRPAPPTSRAHGEAQPRIEIARAGRHQVRAMLALCAGRLERTRMGRPLLALSGRAGGTRPWVIRSAAAASNLAAARHRGARSDYKGDCARHAAAA